MYLRSNVIYIFVCLSNAHVLPYDQKWNNYVVVKRGNQLLCAPKSSFSYVHYSEGGQVKSSLRIKVKRKVRMRDNRKRTVKRKVTILEWRKDRMS